MAAKPATDDQNTYDPTRQMSYTPTGLTLTGTPYTQSIDESRQKIFPKTDENVAAAQSNMATQAKLKAAGDAVSNGLSVAKDVAGSALLNGKALGYYQGDIPKDLNAPTTPQQIAAAKGLGDVAQQQPQNPLLPPAATNAPAPANPALIGTQQNGGSSASPASALGGGLSGGSNGGAMPTEQQQLATASAQTQKGLASVIQNQLAPPAKGNGQDILTTGLPGGMDAYNRMGLINMIAGNSDDSDAVKAAKLHAFFGNEAPKDTIAQLTTASKGLEPMPQSEQDFRKMYGEKSISKTDPMTGITEKSTVPVNLKTGQVLTGETSAQMPQFKSPAQKQAEQLQLQQMLDMASPALKKDIISHAKENGYTLKGM